MIITAKDIHKDINLIHDLVEMAIADRDELGFPFYVFISSKDVAPDHKYVRVKFAEHPDLLKTKDSFIVIIRENGETEIKAGKAPSSDIEKKALLWTKKNKDILTQYWNDPTVFGTTKNFLKQLKPV